MWFLVDPDAETEIRSFRTLGTGNPLTFNTENLEFLGTFQMAEGRLIWHLFEVEQ